MVNNALMWDQLIALMVAERDAELHGRGSVDPVSWPDNDDQLRQTVEFIGRDDMGEVVVEHTRIESFPLQITDEKALYKVFPKGGPELNHENAGRYVLSVKPGAMQSIPYGERRSVARLTTSWVAKNINCVPWPHVPDEPIYIRGGHPYLPFECALWQWLPDRVGLVGPYASVVKIIVARPGDLEALRTQRVRRALADKLPKLLDAAGQQRRSILVLEDRDDRTSAPLLVSRATQAAAHELERTLPDVIYLIQTKLGNPITCVIYEAGIWAHENYHFRWEMLSDARCAELNSML